MIQMIIGLCLLVLIAIVLAKSLSNTFTRKPKNVASAEQQEAPRIYRKTFDIKTQYSSFSNRSEHASATAAAQSEEKQNRNSRHSSGDGANAHATSESFPMNAVVGVAVVSSIVTNHDHKNEDKHSQVHQHHHDHGKCHNHCNDSVNTPDSTSNGGFDSGSGSAG